MYIRLTDIFTYKYTIQSIELDDRTTSIPIVYNIKLTLRSTDSIHRDVGTSKYVEFVC